MIPQTIDAARAFLELLYGSAPPGKIEIASGRYDRTLGAIPKTGPDAFRASSHSSTEDAAAELERLARDGREVYANVSLGTPSGRRLAEKDVTHTVGLVADLDFADDAKKKNHPPDEDAVLAVLEACGRRPTVLVRTGGGLQAWWLFPELLAFPDPSEQEEHETAREEHKAARVRWHETLVARAAELGGWAFDATHDLTRVARVPGTWNHKREERREVEVVWSDGPRCELDELLEVAVDVAPATKRKRKRTAAKRKSAATVERLDSERLDVFLENHPDFGRLWNREDPELAADESRSDFRVAKRAAEIGWPRDELASLIVEHRRRGPDTKGKATRVDYLEKTVARVLESLERRERRRPTTDLGNAERFADRQSGRALYCAGWGKWLLWDGKRWKVDDALEVETLAKETVRSIYGEARDEDDDARRKDLGKWARTSEKAERLRAMLALARSELPVRVEDLDADRWLLNVENGTLDLRAGELRPHRREDRITKLAPVEYDADARCPRFLTFVRQVLGGSDELVEFLRRAVGYALTGSTRERVLFLLHGTGANGKSVLLETLHALLGDYASNTPAETLVGRSSSSASNDLARLAGARLVTCSETEEGKSLATSLLKSLTGRDTVTARFLYREHFEYRPQFKLFFATNHLPRAPAEDLALWDRIRLVPFRIRIPPEEQDRDLPRKLRDELPGVLRWALEGCLAWQPEGLGTPPEVEDATQRYRDDEDHIGRFLAERCVVAPEERAFAGTLHEYFAAYCQREELEPPSARKLGERLEARGFAREKDSATGRMRWIGIGIAPAL